MEVLLWHKSQAVMTHEGEVDEEVQESKEAMQPQELAPAERMELKTHVLQASGALSPSCHQHSRHPFHCDSVSGRHYNRTPSRPDPGSGRGAFLRSFLNLLTRPLGWIPDHPPYFSHRKRRARAMANLPKVTEGGATAAHAHDRHLSLMGAP